MNKRFIKLLTIAIFFFASCIDPYNPPQVEQENSYLVVDGYVDMEQGRSSIILSRTVNLSEPNEIVPQSWAQVSIEFENGTTYNLYETEPGIYYADGLSVTEDDRCKLIISTNGRDYESSFVAVKETPEIDSVTYFADDTGVRVEVTTHDPENSAWYYQWQYEETIKYTSRYRSNYYYRGPNDYPLRTDENDIYTCWKTIPSTTILVNSSSNLTQDVIYKFPLTFMPSTSWKLEHRYSILVKQFAIDKEMYNYWIQLRKNTESLGTLFDPQPSQVTGNIKSLDDPTEPVLGYFSVRSIREERIYIDSSDLPEYTNIENGLWNCHFTQVDTALLADFPPESFATFLFIGSVLNEMGSIIGYTTHDSNCIDCRINWGGEPKKPEWWED